MWQEKFQRFLRAIGEDEKAEKTVERIEVRSTMRGREKKGIQVDKEDARNYVKPLEAQLNQLRWEELDENVMRRDAIRTIIHVIGTAQRHELQVKELSSS